MKPDRAESFGCDGPGIELSKAGATSRRRVRRRVLRQHLQPGSHDGRDGRAATGPAPHLAFVGIQDARKALLRPVQQGQTLAKASRCHQ